MWGAAVGDVSANTALGWLWGTSAAQRLARFPFLPWPLSFVDIETTRDRVVEIATVRMALHEAPAVFHTYVNPGSEGWRRSAQYWNTEIHGLTPQQVRTFPPFQALLPALTAQFERATATGHNVSFERRFLEQEYGAQGRRWERPELCTLKFARLLYPQRSGEGGGFRLDQLAAAFDLRNPAPHRAIGDTVTTVWLLLAMLESKARDPALQDLVQRATRGTPRVNPWTTP